MKETGVVIKVNGKSVDQYEHNGCTFIEARDGTEYTITVQNHSYKRKLAIITVDGINVITGEPQGNDNKNGYVISAYNVVEIKGFRQDLNSVGTFKFCRKDGSYCNEKGLGGNNGVIGVRVYDEKSYKVTWTSTSSDPDEKLFYKRYGDTKLWPETAYRSSIVCSTISSQQDDSFDLGTTWGKKVVDSAIEVSFDPEVDFDETIIYYDTRINLEKMGINFKKEKQISMPKAFGNFAKPPKGWNG